MKFLIILCLINLAFAAPENCPLCIFEPPLGSEIGKLLDCTTLATISSVKDGSCTTGVKVTCNYPLLPLIGKRCCCDTSPTTTTSTASATTTTTTTPTTTTTTPTTTTTTTTPTTTTVSTTTTTPSCIKCPLIIFGINLCLVGSNTNCQCSTTKLKCATAGFCCS